MKKIIAFLVVIVMTFSLFSTVAIAEKEKFDIIQMSNYMNHGLVLQRGKWTLSLGIYDPDNNILNLEAYNSASKETSRLSKESEVPLYISMDGLWVVYIAVDMNDSSVKIKKRRN